MGEKARVKQLFKEFAKLRDQENKILSEIWEILIKNEKKTCI